MFFKKQFRGIAIFTLSAFLCFTFSFEYSYAQEENPLLNAQGLYKQGKFIEAVKVLETFIEKISGSPTEQKRLAEAYYLLARIYYEASEDARVEEYLKQAVEAFADIGKEEGDLDFKARLERARGEWQKIQVSKDKTTPVVENETAKKEAAKSIMIEKEKPAPQFKIKKKFPWLLTILGVGVVAALVVLLTKKKDQTLTEQTLNVTIGEGVNGTPAAGSYNYQKDAVVNYSYSLQSGYSNLTVNLDGSSVAASGDISMNGNHNLTVSATKIVTTSFWDGFESSSVGSPPTDWEIYTNGNSIAVTDSTFSEGSKSLFMQGKPNNSAIIQRWLSNFGFTTGTFNITYFMKVDGSKWTGTEGEANFSVTFFGKELTLGVKKVGGVLKMQYIDTGVRIVDIPGGVNVENWIVYKIVFNSVSGIAQYYVNNILLGQGSSYASSSSNRITLGVGVGNSYPSAYFDSISIIR